MSTTPFEVVLASAKAGDPHACAGLYESLKRPIFTYVRLRGAVDPDDVTSEVFLQVFRDLHHFEGDEPGFRAWVYTIAHRRVLDDRRMRSRRPVQAVLDDTADRCGGDVEDEALNATADRRVQAALSALTAEQRDVVLLRVVADLPLEQVADVMGRSVNAVKALQHRALAALRRSIEQAAVTP